MLGGVGKLSRWIRLHGFVIEVTLQRAWLKARPILAESFDDSLEGFLTVRLRELARDVEEQRRP